MAKKITTEERILGMPETKEITTQCDYENPERKYKITNLEVNNKPIIVTGDLVETFIGGKNKDARNELKEGAKSVYTKDLAGNKIYKIEVVE